MFNQEQAPQEPYPATEEERDTLISQTINLIHSEEVSDSLAKFFNTSNKPSPVEPIAQMGAQLALKVITALEQQVGRDIPGETELAVLAMAIEELYTIVKNFGVEVNQAMVANSVQLGSQMFNDSMAKGKQGMKEQAQRPQGPPPSALQGGTV